ncbi:MAG TPA: hypothetical protein VMS02_05805, partial [Solirubrobacteraceae bacterium]|nr:hypothetical protein [Solirubrobacteraceae bacterium]
MQPILAAALAALALSAALSPPAARAGESPRFAITQFTVQTTGIPNGPPFVESPEPFTQAGGHPTALTLRIEFATETVAGSPAPVHDPHDVFIELPPGLFVNPQAMQACPREQTGICPADTQVGVYELRIPGGTLQAPIVNLVPLAGEPAALGFETPDGVLPLSGRLVSTPGGYALAVEAASLPMLGVSFIEVTLWGNPVDGAHDPQRGIYCLRQTGQSESCGTAGETSGAVERPFLTFPSNCSQPLTATVWADSWQELGSYARAQASLPALDGCDRLRFSPTLALQPESSEPEAPTGTQLALTMPQPESVVGLAAPPLRAMTVNFPAGMAIDPAVGDGVRACPASGPEGIDLPAGAGGERLSPLEVGEGEEAGPGGEPGLAAGNCPSASTLGTAEAHSPLLSGALSGRVYLAAPACGGAGERRCGEQDAADGKLYRVYVELGGRGERDPRGLVVKLLGELLVAPATGQLTLRLPESPQLPLDELSIDLSGGARALLANPAACGQASTTAQFEPWGAPLALDASSRSFYEVNGCTSPQPFAPTLVAGSDLIQAGGSTPFRIRVERGEGEQQL